MNYTEGYSLAYALTNPYKKPRKPRLPKGWRWLKVGEYIEYGDVACDTRIPPVKRIVGGEYFNKMHHPIRRKI